jgi:hypothetical protein
LAGGGRITGSEGMAVIASTWHNRIQPDRELPRPEHEAEQNRDRHGVACLARFFGEAVRRETAWPDLLDLLRIGMRGPSDP